MLAAVALIATMALAGPAGAQTTTYTSTETIPVPPASDYAGVGGGDGWDVSMSPEQVFNIFHHSGSVTMACHKQSDASECYPARTITDGNGDGFSSSSHSGTYLDPSNGHLLTFATRNNNQTAGVVCIDTTVAETNDNPFCGFTELTATGDGGITSAPQKSGDRLYAFNFVNSDQTGDRDKLLCYDLSTNAACAGQPIAMDIGSGAVVNGTFPVPGVALIGDQLLVPVTAGGTPRIACHDTGTGSECAGSWPIDAPADYVDGSNDGNGSPFPMLASDGTVTGFCLPTTSNQCFGLDGASAATPPNMTTALGHTDRWNATSVTIGARVYLAAGYTVTGGAGDQVKCYNYAAQASCDNFPLAMTGSSYIYTVNRDPQRPTCIWTNADGGSAQIQNFDAFTGGPCGQGATRVLSEQLVASGTECEPATYRKFEVLKPERAGYTDGTVGFADNNGGATSIPDKPLDANGAVDLTGIGLESVDKPQFLVSLNGTGQDPSEVVVRLTWEGTYDQKCTGDGVEAQPPPAASPTPTPTTSPTPTPTVEVQGNVSRSCAGKRRFRIVLRHQKTVRYRSASFTLAGKKIKTRRFGGKIGAIVDLRKLGKKTVVLKIKAVTSDGVKLSGKRVYHPCTRKRPKTPPKL